jgi:hypothetical protein
LQAKEDEMIGQDRVRQIWAVLQQPRTYQRLTGLQIAVTICTVSVASMRLYGVVLPDVEWHLRVLLFLHGLAFLWLLAMLFLPRFASQHHMVSFVLAGYAWLSVILWIFFGQAHDIVGYVTASIESVLSVFAFYEGCRTLRLGTPLQQERQDMG